MEQKIWAIGKTILKVGIVRQKWLGVTGIRAEFFESTHFFWQTFFSDLCIVNLNDKVHAITWFVDHFLLLSSS